MKIDFKSFRNSEEIVEFFQGKVRIHSSTSDEVEAILGEVGLKHSHLELVGTNKYGQTFPSYSFNYVISCSIPSRPTMLIFANMWMVHFHFDKDKLLAKIEARKYSAGI